MTPSAPSETASGAVALPALTSIRFYFAIAVVLFHLVPFMEASGYDRLPQPFRAIVYHGYLGVDFFFVLSGFILVYSSRARLADPSRDRAFWVARFARIYPGYCLGFALSLLIAVQAMIVAGDRFMRWDEFAVIAILNVFVIQAWVPAAALMLNGPAWSVSAEAFFYALFPKIFRWAQKISTTRLLAVAVLLYTSSLASGIYFWLQPAPISEAISTVLHLQPRFAESTEQFYMYFPLIRLPEFGLGCIAGTIFVRHGAQLQQFSRVFLLLSGFLFAIVLYGAASVLPRSILSNGLLAPVVVLLLFGLAHARSGLLVHPVSQTLGEASFALYILHMPIWTVMARLDLRYTQLQSSHPVLFVCAYLAVAIIASLASLILVETPARRWIRNSLANASTKRQLAAAA